ncbi:MAG: hypothetical protein Q6352_008315, partial [Candidatus Freyrarchaeum guaymaensis]
MKIYYQKIIHNKKARGILLITSVLILVLMFTLYHQNNFYCTPQFTTGFSSKDGNFQICYRGEYTIITVRMLNSTDPITGELTLFYDESNGLLIGGEFTNSSGYAVLNWSIPPDYNLGPTIIKATCPDRPDATPVYTDLLIKSKTTFENLTYPPSVHPKECLVIEADLRDNINRPLPNQSVYLYDYQNNSVNESTTDMLGHCTLSWMVPSNMVPGLCKFNIKFEGDQLYESTENEFNVTIKGKAFFENLTHPASAYPEECLVVEVDLRDNNYSPLSNQSVYLYDCQNSSLAVSTTDLVGHCTLSWMIPSDTAPGIYGFRVRFKGDQLYESTENEFNVTIKGKAFFENLTHPASAYPEECLVVEVDLRDNNYSPLS